MLDKKNKSNSANIGALLLSRGTGLGMIVILCLLGLRAPLFFEMTNIMTVLKQGSVLTMIALGLTAVLIGGGFDMGAGALVQLTCNGIFLWAHPAQPQCPHWDLSYRTDSLQILRLPLSMN